MRIISLKNFKETLSYNKWANIRLIDNVSKTTDSDYYKNLPIPFHTIHDMLFHLFYYDVKYYYKIIDQSNMFKKETQLTRAHLAELILFYSKKWLDWIEELIRASQLLSSFEEISKNITDICIHNNYHRGQINTVLSCIGYTPESLDIFVYNNNFSKHAIFY